MAPHAVLGVPRSASVVEIKKAYARLLKQNRPDDDPVAFQNLQHAYEACIAHARQRAERRPAAVAREPQVEEPSADPDNAEGQHLLAPEQAGPGPRRPPPRRPPLFPPDAAPSPLPPSPPRRAARVLEPAMPAERQQALFDEMLAVAAQQGAAALAGWLQSCEDWYSLHAKEQGVAPLVERLVRDGKALDLDSLKLVIEFFDLAAHGLDPRVHRLGQFLFERHEFSRALADIRRRHQTWAERLMYRELTQPHDRWRRAFLFSVPVQGSRLRGLALQILAANEDQALEVLNPEALSFWMPLTDPQRLGWRALASTLVQAGLAAGLVAAAISSQAQDSFTVWAYLGSSLAALWCGLWLVMRLIGVTLRSVEQRRLARTGSKLPQAGESILYDPQSLLVLGLALSTLIICLLRVGGLVSVDATTWIPVLPLVAVPFLLLGSGRLRWEMGAMTLLLTVMFNQVLELYLPALLPPVGNGLAIASSLSLLMALLTDGFHALSEKLARPLARREFNPAALGLGLAAMILMGVLADSQTAAQEAMARAQASPQATQGLLPEYAAPSADAPAAGAGWQVAPGGERESTDPGETLPAACDCGPPAKVKGGKPAGTLSWAKLRARYNQDGAVELVQLEADSGDQAFNEAAMAHAYRAWRIRPGKLDGVPQAGSVSVTVEQHYPFLVAP